MHEKLKHAIIHYNYKSALCTTG